MSKENSNVENEKGQVESKFDREVRIGIVLTNRNLLSFDQFQFKLYVKNEPKDFDGDWSEVQYSQKQTYHPTILNAMKHISIDECKDVLQAYYDLEDFGERFEELVAKPHNDRVESSVRWFESFMLNDEIEEKNEKLKSELINVRKELSEAKKKIRHYEGLSDEADATGDTDNSDLVEKNPDMSIR